MEHGVLCTLLLKCNLFRRLKNVGIARFFFYTIEGALHKNLSRKKTPQLTVKTGFIPYLSNLLFQ